MNAPAIVIAAVALTACATVIGLDTIRYDDGAGDAGSDAASDATDAGCTGAVCGSRCCARGAACLGDGKTCANDIAEVSAGGNSACALLADGSVWCWGENSMGAVGVDAGTDDVCVSKNPLVTAMEPCRFRATRVQVLPEVSHISVGFQFACAVARSDGAVWCWGRNVEGALGHDPGTASDGLCANNAEFVDGGGPSMQPCNPVPQKVSGISDATQLAASQNSACARKKDGTVFCWGRNGNGELGDPDAGVQRTSAAQVPGLPADITQLASNLEYPGTCAVSDAGLALCWGQATQTPPPPPHAVTEDGGTDPSATPLTDLVKVVTGNNFFCALRKDGDVRCAGQNVYDELGSKRCDDAGHPAPLPVIGVTKVVLLDARWNHVCAVDEAGLVYCWGLAQLGALGTGTIAGNSTCSLDLSAGTPNVVPGIPRALHIAVGIATSFAATDDGLLWAWGTNDTARLGHVPRTNGDLTNCGDMGNQSVCNPFPKPVQGLP
jgi:alpha-tubulin suppressor-like RCC1 family protein